MRAPMMGPVFNIYMQADKFLKFLRKHYQILFLMKLKTNKFTIIHKEALVPELPF